MPVLPFAWLLCCSHASAAPQETAAVQGEAVLQQDPEQLAQLVAPIALYPDALVAQILAAATYPTEIVEAERWMQQHSNLTGEQLAQAVNPQSWDPSVKALTQFPSVLANLDKNLSWTSSLGDAYINQQQDVMNAVQEMRKRAKDAGKVVSCLAPGNVMFVLAPPLQHKSGPSPDKKGVEEWFASFRGPLGFEVRDLVVVAGAEVAFCHSLNHLTGTKNDGERADYWFRETLGFRKLAGKWKITHDHESVPVHMDGSGRAAFDLEPE